MNLKHPVTVVTIGALVLGVAAFTEWKPEDRRFSEAKNTVLMREIGHTLLLQSGDSTSLVLPVVQPAKDEYQLRFASSWSFIPDSLVSTVRQVIRKGDFPGNYVVNVLKCTTNEVMFGYAILAKEEKQVIACVGRLQPKNCYYINISFQPETGAGQTGKWIIASAILAFLLFVLTKFFLNKRKKQPEPEQEQAGIPQPEGIAIGKYFLSGGELKWEGQIIPLSMKEVKLLSIFAASPNQVIDRSRLQKEGWEDEGVIVGRSLDVFISKLRKKLEHDPAVKLVNIHGKGYKLEIGEVRS